MSEVLGENHLPPPKQATSLSPYLGVGVDGRVDRDARANAQHEGAYKQGRAQALGDPGDAEREPVLAHLWILC